MDRLHATLCWLDDHLEETILIVLLVAITFLTGLQVVMRKLFANSLTWSEELCRYCFMWTAFISVAYCVRKRAAIAINAFTILLPGRVQTALLLVTSILSMLVFGSMFRASLLIFARTFNSHQSSPAMGIPFYLIYFGAVLGFGFSLVRLVQIVVIDCKRLFAGREKRER